MGINTWVSCTYQPVATTVARMIILVTPTASSRVLARRALFRAPAPAQLVWMQFERSREAIVARVVLISTEGRNRKKRDQPQALAPLFRVWQGAVRKKPRNTMPLETRFSELLVTKMISKISFDDENPMKP